MPDEPKRLDPLYVLDLAQTRAAAVLARVKDLELPVDKKALRVERVGGRIRISYRYSVPINLVVTTYDWSIEAKIDRLIVIT